MNLQTYKNKVLSERKDVKLEYEYLKEYYSLIGQEIFIRQASGLTHNDISKKAKFNCTSNIKRFENSNGMCIKYNTIKRIVEDGLDCKLEIYFKYESDQSEKDLHKSLKMAIIRRGISISEISRRTNICDATISNYENNENSNPSIYYLSKIAYCLNMELVANIIPNDEELRRRINNVNKLKKARLNNNLSIEFLSTELKINYKKLVKFEQGKQILSKFAMKKLSKYLDIDFE